MVVLLLQQCYNYFFVTRQPFYTTTAIHTIRPAFALVILSALTLFYEIRERKMCGLKEDEEEVRECVSLHDHPATRCIIIINNNNFLLQNTIESANTTATTIVVIIIIILSMNIPIISRYHEPTLFLLCMRMMIVMIIIIIMIHHHTTFITSFLTPLRRITSSYPHQVFCWSLSPSCLIIWCCWWWRWRRCSVDQTYLFFLCV